MTRIIKESSRGFCDADTDLAAQHNATIAIERLYKLRRRKGQLSRKSRRKTNRIPYAFFRQALTHKSVQLGIRVLEVPAKYTSQTCPRCRYISRQNRRNWRYFRCVGCGLGERGSCCKREHLSKGDPNRYLPSS